MKISYIVTLTVVVPLLFAVSRQLRESGNPNTNQIQEAFMSTDKMQERVKTSPAGVKLEFENDAVQVLRIRMAPHEKTPIHDITPRVVVWLTTAHLRIALADGTTMEARPKAGEVSWVPAQRHAGENLGDQPLEFLAIVPKESGTHAKEHE